MSFLPYPEIPYSTVRTSDILLLLTFGFVYELFVRLWQHSNERRTSHERHISSQLSTLNYEAAKKRALGPTAFVRASKLERAVLSAGKKLTKLKEERGARTIRVRGAVKKINIACNLLVLAVYWGVAMIEVDGARVHLAGFGRDTSSSTDLERAGTLWNGVIFPLSYYGTGYSITQRGLDADARTSSVGALAVVWAARVTCGEIFECAMSWLGP